MPFGRYTYAIAVDFIEFEVQCAERHKFWTIQNALMAAQRLPSTLVPFVNPYDENGIDTNHASDIFRFKIQDPKSYSSVKAVIDELNDQFHFIGPVRLLAIELAFDTYRAYATAQQLAKIAFDRYRFSTHTPLANWHFYRREGEKPIDLNPQKLQKDRNHREFLKLFEDGWQLTDTNDKSVDLRVHGYVKTTDNGGEPLPISQHRARDERTFQGDALPCTTMEELSCLDFSSLARYFKFRRLADDLHPCAVSALTTGSELQLGRPGLTAEERGPKEQSHQKKYQRKHATIVGKYDGSSVFRGSTVADAQLNKEVRNQLRTLTTNWRK